MLSKLVVSFSAKCGIGAVLGVGPWCLFSEDLIHGGSSTEGCLDLRNTQEEQLHEANEAAYSCSLLLSRRVKPNYWFLLGSLLIRDTPE